MKTLGEFKDWFFLSIASIAAYLLVSIASSMRDDFKEMRLELADLSNAVQSLNVTLVETYTEQKEIKKKVEDHESRIRYFERK